MRRATPRFWDRFHRLPPTVQRAAERSFERLENDPAHPSLRFKKVGKFWSARVSRDHRALAVEDEEGFIWVWIGSHDDYDRMIAAGP